MAAWERVGRLPVGVEIALASAAGAGAFALAAVAVASIDSGVVAAFLGVVFVVAVIAIARFTSIAYAVPVGMAGMLAFDWFYLPPTHPLEFPDSANLVDLMSYLAVAVLLGVLAAHAVGRAAGAERARGEIAEEQAALRRVATLVARGRPPVSCSPRWRRRPASCSTCTAFASPDTPTRRSWCTSPNGASRGTIRQPPTIAPDW